MARTRRRAGWRSRTPRPARAPAPRLRSTAPRRRRTAAYLPVGIAAVLAVAVVGALAIGAGNGVIGTAVRTSAAPTSVAAVAVPAALLPTPTPTAEPVFAPTGQTTQATVKRVIDGDTIIVLVGDTEYRVRYIGVDAPESVSLARPVEFMGRDAADANRRLVSSATVVLERDQSDTDAYGQLLRHVWVERDGTLALVGLEMVRAGLARIEPSAQDTKYAALFEDAQEAARAAGLGIWSAPPLPITGTDAGPGRGVPAAPRPRGPDHDLQLRADPAVGRGGGLHLALRGVRGRERPADLGRQGVRDPILRVRLAARTRERGRGRVDDRRPRARPRDRLAGRSRSTSPTRCS